MSSSLFECKTHQLECAHVRGNFKAVGGPQETVLRLAVKQYIPLKSRETVDQKVQSVEEDREAVTIIAAHGNGLAKELYEPLFDELLREADRTGCMAIRGIWIADMANQGYSGLLNAGKLGNELTWEDHARDLLHMVNTFRREMPRPLVGVGHSLGSVTLVQLAQLHPRLLSALVIIEPIIHSAPAGGDFRIIRAALRGRDAWPSRADAADYFRRDRIYKLWDPRCFARLIEHGVRETDEQEATDPRSGDRKKRVVSTTTRAQETFSFGRRGFVAGSRDVNDFRPTTRSHPEFPQTEQAAVALASGAFYCADSYSTFSRLPSLRPACLWMHGSKSTMPTAAADLRAERLARTGTGWGGSGGVEAGATEDVNIEGGSHFVPFELPSPIARAALPWMARQLEEVRKAERAAEAEWAHIEVQRRGDLDEDFLYWAGKTTKPLSKDKSRL